MFFFVNNNHVLISKDGNIIKFIVHIVICAINALGGGGGGGGGRNVFFEKGGGGHL